MHCPPGYLGILHSHHKTSRNLVESIFYQNKGIGTLVAREATHTTESKATISGREEREKKKLLSHQCHHSDVRFTSLSHGRMKTHEVPFPPFSFPPSSSSMSHDSTIYLRNRSSDPPSLPPLLLPSLEGMRRRRGYKHLEKGIIRFLRIQLHRVFRKPLIVFTPKSLMRPAG